ncbi:jg10753 [Pararge aegeria aegeria]|uniref:Jg10753 protein n=1 Tax=Pararge aegeria aegeria TaxID=348720 RepID=A0A8S4RIE6_9NEOP|nr:jg10753 [Pararge aegeria aegeria]
MVETSAGEVGGAGCAARARVYIVKFDIGAHITRSNEFRLCSQDNTGRLLNEASARRRRAERNYKQTTY